MVALSGWDERAGCQDIAAELPRHGVVIQGRLQMPGIRASPGATRTGVGKAYRMDLPPTRPAVKARGPDETA